MSNDYLSILTILPAILWIGILMIVGLILQENDLRKKTSPFFLVNLQVKIFFSVSFALVYLLYYGGGDTTAYFDGAINLNNLFLKSPQLYFKEIFNEPDYIDYWNTYDTQTGFPPGWIYREPEAFFVCKILSLLSVVCFKSYLALTVIISFIVSSVSWKLYVFLKKYNFTSDRNLAFAILFIPSVNFWCSGVSKDTFVYVGICYILLFAFKLLESGKSSIKTYFFLLISCWFLYHTRTFMLYAIALPFALVLVSRLVRKLGGKDRTVRIFRTFILLLGFGLITYFFSTLSESELLESSSMLQQAEITQGDFATNDTYGDNNFSIGEIEFTFLGLLKVAPSAIFAGLFRPTILEALEPSLLLNGLESLLLIFALIRFLMKGSLRKYQYIRTNEYLYFCLIFVLILSFITGLTSGLFGVLVRLRAPLLPFLALLLLVDYSSTLKSEESQEVQE